MKFIRRNINYLLIIAALCSVMATDGYKEITRIKLKGDIVLSDEMGNAFVVNNNQLTKYSPGGKKLYTYSNLSSGDIGFIDIHDPFKILVYYPDFGQIELLDHTLSLTSSTIDLNTLGLGLSTLACASYQGAFWTYNPINFELVRVNQYLEVSERTGNLQQATGYELNPNYMLERDNNLYLNDPATGVLIFDKYGTYYKTIPIPGLESFQVFNRKIIYVQGDKISIYDTKLNEHNSTYLPCDDALSVSACLSLDPQRIYALKDGELVFYEIQ